jgi:hypothetical protein
MVGLLLTLLLVLSALPVRADGIGGMFGNKGARLELFSAMQTNESIMAGSR